MINYEPWVKEIVKCSFDYILAAEHLEVSVGEIQDYALEHADEIALCKYGEFRARVMFEADDRLIEFKDYEFQKIFDSLTNRPVAPVNNIQNNLTIDGTNPREVLKAELDRLNSRTTSNGYERPREIS